MKNITGLAAAVPDSPSTGTYGGINRANYSFWRSQKYSGVTDGGSAVSASNIQGLDLGAAPSSRRIGVNLRFTF